VRVQQLGSAWCNPSDQRHVLDIAGLKADERYGSAVTLIQRFGSAAKLNVHPYCLELHGGHRSDADRVATTTCDITQAQVGFR
jgi:hypothetical protein